MTHNLLTDFETRVMDDDIEGDDIIAEVLSDGTMRIHTSSHEYSDQAIQLLNQMAVDRSDSEQKLRFDVEIFQRGEPEIVEISDVRYETP